MQSVPENLIGSNVVVTGEHSEVDVDLLILENGSISVTDLTAISTRAVLDKILQSIW